MKSVVICEKPSQARNVRAAVGDQYGQVLAARGHLLRLAEPEEVNLKWKPWSYEVLRPESGRYPFVADTSGGKSAVLDELSRALGQADTVIIATDCDREGQAIGENIVRHCAFQGDVFRAMFSAEDPETIRAAFANKRPNADYAPLYQAACARAQADQIVNLSMTRAATLALKPSSMRGALGIGRVKTPTMGLVCRREAELAAFQPRDYFDLFLSVTDTEGPAVLKLRWVAPEDARLYDAAQAAAIVEPLAGWTGPVQVKTERKTQGPPKPLDLPALQQRAARWGWTAKQTLEAAQSLYETHQITTYPRAETRYLPEVESANAGAMLEALRDLPFVTVGYREPTIRKGKSGAFSDAGLAGASHHAIMPNPNTRQHWAERYGQLSSDERQLFEVIARGYLAAIGPDWVYDRTEISAQPADRKFTAAGTVDVEPGWRAAMKGDEPAAKTKDKKGGDEADDEVSLPAWADGTAVHAVEAGVEKKTTKAPPRYTEGSLIKAMQEAWRFAEDPAQAERLKEAKGIGTPATRDTVIEGLKRQGLLEVEKKKLKASELAMAVDALLRREAPEALDPAATADLERRLDDILSAHQDADAVITALAGHAAAFNEKMRARGDGKPLDVTVPEAMKEKGGKPTKAALAFARKLAAACGKKIPKQTLGDRIRLSQWIDQHKRPSSDEPSDKQLAFARSLAGRKQIEIAQDTLRSRRALSAWLSTQAGGAFQKAKSLNIEEKQRCGISRLRNDARPISAGERNFVHCRQINSSPWRSICVDW